MKSFTTLFAAVAALISLAAVNPAAAHDHTIMIDAPFARASASPMAKAGGAFMTITNNGDMDDVLIDARGDAAARIELHTHVMKDGAMTMMRVEDGIPVPAGETVMLQPGGYHVMFMGLKAPLVEGETVHITLVFDKAGEIAVDIPVLDVGAMGGGKGQQKHQMNMSN
ncbi:copper chaperone PCu(A)C [Rhodospirillaceae bacterium KN72]|uniref:Copper chaperone PCu(A)C n=1 Tax=Pacificispira spongiicola TaxID=2729598 RepID=A0A7Y0DZ77_9PROT|nr:copper chaperone PCu(A)C [Pacificispira spongiicola]NMM43546.1 copper chaperone PCu(A)C [Pacificispira spongiicola]